MIYSTSRVWACCSFGLEWPFTTSPSSEALLQVLVQMPPLPSSYRMGSGCPPLDSHCVVQVCLRHSTPSTFPFPRWASFVFVFTPDAYFLELRCTSGTWQMPADFGRMDNDENYNTGALHPQGMSWWISKLSDLCTFPVRVCAGFQCCLQ